MNFKFSNANLGFWSKLVEGLAFVTVFSTLGISLMAMVINKSGYDVNYTLLSRIMVFSVIIGYLILRKFFSVTQIQGAEKYQDGLTIAILGSLTVFSAVTFTLWTVNSASILDIIIPAFVFGLLYGLRALLAFKLIAKLAFLAKYTLMALVFFALTLPFLSSKYLNSESYFDPVVINQFQESQHKKLDHEKEYFYLNLDDKSLANVRLNVEKLKSDNGSKFNIGYYEISTVDARNEIRFFLVRSDISALCLLGEYSNKKNSKISKCILNINGAARDSKRQLLTAIDAVPFYDASQKSEIFNEINSANFDNITVKHIGVFGMFSDMALAKIMFVRGAYFHHYNSIAHTINTSEKITGYLSNQYGLGPLLFVKGISELFDTTTFDSIYLSIGIVNFLIFSFLLIFLKEQRKEKIIWLGFSMSILVTYFISNTLAPFLYFTRCIPVILLVIILFNAVFKNVNVKASPLYLLGLIGTMALTAVYNFEYAVLTFSAILVAGLIARSAFYIVSGSVFFALSVAFKIFFTAAKTEGGANYLAYIAGVGFDSTMGYLTYIFLASLISILISAYLVAKKVKLQNELLVLAILPVFLCVKVLWIGSVNHVGPLFLIVSLLLLALKKFADRQQLGIMVDKAVVFYYASSAIVLIGSLLNWPIFYQNYKFEKVEYTQTSISNLFKVSSGLVEKIDSFKKIYTANDLVLSPIDNALSLSVGHHLTKPYPDISTNINYPIDIHKVIKAYSSSSVERIIIDQDVISTISKEPIYHSIGTSIPFVIGSSRGFADNLRKMEYIYQNLLAHGFRQCDQNNDFVVLCRAN